MDLSCLAYPCSRGEVARINKKKRFLFNSLLMSVTSVLVSGIGVWFSLAVSSAIGEEAMGVFQLILSVVSFGSTFACSGIQLAAARLTAKKLGEKKTEESPKERSKKEMPESQVKQ